MNENVRISTKILLKIVVVQLTLCQHLLSNGSALNKGHAIILTSDSIFYSNINQSFSLNVIRVNNFINTLRPRQNGRQIPDDNFKCIFMIENI